MQTKRCANSPIVSQRSSPTVQQSPQDAPDGSTSQRCEPSHVSTGSRRPQEPTPSPAQRETVVPSTQTSALPTLQQGVHPRVPPPRSSHAKPVGHDVSRPQKWQPVNHVSQRSCRPPSPQRRSPGVHSPTSHAVHSPPEQTGSASGQARSCYP